MATLNLAYSRIGSTVGCSLTPARIGCFSLFLAMSIVTSVADTITADQPSLTNRIESFVCKLRKDNVYLLDQQKATTEFHRLIAVALDETGRTKDDLSGLLLDGAMSVIGPALAVHADLDGRDLTVVKHSYGEPSHVKTVRPVFARLRMESEKLQKPDALPVFPLYYQYKDIAVWLVANRVIAVTPRSDRLEKYLSASQILLNAQQTQELLKQLRESGVPEPAKQ